MVRVDLGTGTKRLRYELTEVQVDQFPTVAISAAKS